jgi:hypothetical protein
MPSAPRFSEFGVFGQLRYCNTEMERDNLSYLFSNIDSNIVGNFDHFGPLSFCFERITAGQGSGAAASVKIVTWCRWRGTKRVQCIRFKRGRDVAGEFLEAFQSFGLHQQREALALTIARSAPRT